jgi:hypothetical protein
VGPTRRHIRYVRKPKNVGRATAGGGAVAELTVGVVAPADDADGSDARAGVTVPRSQLNSRNAFCDRHRSSSLVRGSISKLAGSVRAPADDVSGSADRTSVDQTGCDVGSVVDAGYVDSIFEMIKGTIDA